VGAVDLSVLIPSRNEEFLLNTVNDVLANIQADTEIICVLDGSWPIEPIPDSPRITLIHHPTSIGQRAAINEAARVSTAKYVMKFDAHCAVAPGFDKVLLEDMQPDWTQVPIMRNLHVFDWVCDCGHRMYQRPTPESCPNCNGQMTKEIVWIAKTNPQSKAYCFDSTPHFQYFGEFSKRPEGKGDLTESMSLQGSCFMMTRERYLELEVCDESIGSWGSQGIEVACKTWLSGGRVIVNHRTWYAHLFRKYGDFGFPYPLSGKETEYAKEQVRELFFENRWPKQIKPLSWLVEKFWPVPGWTDEDLKRIAPSKAAIYYTDNRLDSNIMQVCQNQLKQSLNGHKLVSVSLKPLDLGENITLDLERGYLTMFKQILAGLEACMADVVFLCEHDVLYHPSHFDFTPPDRTKIYYNANVWHLRVSDGHAVYYTAKRTSQLCAYRDVLIRHYRKRVALVEQDGFSRKMGFEPGSHNRTERVDDLKSDTWQSEHPNVDIKHDQNLTPARWKQEAFRDKRNCQNWQESDEIPYWGVTKNIFMEVI